MAEYITLLGAEEVRNAANILSHAAERMNAAAREFSSSIVALRQINDDFIMQLRDTLEADRKARGLP